MAQELWRDVVGFEGYYIVSNMGNVMSLPRRANHVSGTRISFGRILKPNKIWNGYLQVTLCVDGKRYQRLIHRLVAEAFIPNPSNLPQVNHRDFDRANNAANNLEWCTAGENTSYSERAGRLHHESKRIIRSDGEVFESIAAAAQAMNIDPSTISVALNTTAQRKSKRTAGGYTFEFA